MPALPVESCVDVDINHGHIDTVPHKRRHRMLSTQWAAPPSLH